MTTRLVLTPKTGNTKTFLLSVEKIVGLAVICNNTVVSFEDETGRITTVVVCESFDHISSNIPNVIKSPTFRFGSNITSESYYKHC